jgi:urease beta subunit
MQNLIAPSNDFRSVRDGRNTQLFYVDIALDTARSVAAGTQLVLPISGNSFYCDADPSDGNARVHFQDTNFDRGPTPLYVSPGCIFNIPFTQCLFENSAQPGKKVRIAYGIDVDFQPGSVAQIAVTNAGGFTSVRPEAATNSYASNGTLLVNTADPIFLPAANVNGAIVYNCGFVDTEAASHQSSILAKTSAPGSVIDGEVICMGDLVSAAGPLIGRMYSPQYIAAGKGLYFYSNAAQTNSNAYPIRHARYKLL